MAYSITQARPLLNAAELELFDQSRAGPIKSLTLARLRGKVTRVRALRDKYRDLFRRQTVAVRKAPSTKGRSPVGADNERTQRKADILQEVLGRFEARVSQLEAQEARGAGGAASAKSAAKRPKAGSSSSPRKTTADRSGATTPNAAAKKPAAAAKESVATKKPATAKKPTRAGRAGDSDGAGKAAPAGRGAGIQSKAAAPVAVPAASNQRAAPSAKKKATVTTQPPVAPVLQPVLAEVLNQHATRSPKAPSDMAPTANGKAQAPQPPAPTSLVPAALRGNPLKQAPGQIAIHAHQGSSVRRAQGKRDSR